MLNSQRRRVLVFLLRLPKFQPLQHPLSFSLKFCTDTDTSSRSYRVSYLVNNLGFPSEIALKASERLRFKTSQQPDSILAFFRHHGFSDSNIRDMVRKEPLLLSSKPHKTIFPKFQFFQSKGVSTADMVRLVAANPRILLRGLDNHIIPFYELVRRFFKSDKHAIAFMIRQAILISYNKITPNVKLLADYGVSDSSINRLLTTRPSMLGSKNFHHMLEEVKGLGFEPSKSNFVSALIAKKAMSKTRWDEKVDAFKKWGWSEEIVLQVFKKNPYLMLASTDKINSFMSFWVNQLGWDSLELIKGTHILFYSMEKRIIPRASVLQFLLKKGLLRKNASLISPFKDTEKVFLNKFVYSFREESSILLKLYEGT